MPSRQDTNFPPLTDADEFESLVCDICAFEWGDPHTQKFGRKGQKQHGVDVYGQLVDVGRKYVAAQCKLRTKRESLTASEIEAEVNEARRFSHPLETLIIVTDGPRDTNVQIIVDKISEHEVSNGGFRVIIWFWDDITRRLAAYPRLIVRYYSDYFASLTTLPIIERLIDTPLQVVSIKAASQTPMTPLDECLKFRGTCVLGQDKSAIIPQMAQLDQILPDGLVFQYDVPLNEPHTTPLLRFASTIGIYKEQVEANCPIFVVLPSKLIDQFLANFTSLGSDAQRAQIIADDLPANKTADHIFNSIFNYGYPRRGGLTTVEISARTYPGRPNSALLDIDWQTKLSTTLFPTPAAWQSDFVPALETITKQVISLGNAIRIQINSQLPLPAAFALGFFFNLRVARVGVWARKTGVSDFRYQFWSSDGASANVTFPIKWVKKPEDNSRSAIVELTTYVSIHDAVRTFVKETGLEADAWLQVHLETNGQTVTSIDESLAIAYAGQVGQVIRQLNGQGITDIYLFARIPSALAVLVGQRLQACGVLHFYWFDNPTYRFAFSLK